MIKTEVSGATSSMTAVPKPLKFLTPMYPKMTEAYKNCKSEDDFKVSDSLEYINQILKNYFKFNRKN